MTPGGDSPEFVENSTYGAPVRGFLHRSRVEGAPGLVLTHGAGANCQSTLLTAVAEAFWSAGMSVLRCDLPFRQARPHGPPLRSSEKDQDGLKAAVAYLREQTSGSIFLGGHSYGGRQASMLAAGEPGLVEAVLLLSYPLHPPQRPEELRTKHFPDLRTPAMFVSGTCDGFGTIAEMEGALRLIPARTELLAISGSGHELISKKNRAELPGQLSRAFLSFANQESPVQR